MMITMTSLVFMWLLPLTACSAVTSGLTNNITNVTLGEEVKNEFIIKQMATNQTSVSKQLSESPGFTVTPPTTEDVHPIENKTRSTPSLHTNTSTTISVSTGKTAASVNSEWMDFTSSMEISTIEVTKSISTVQTSQATDPTTPSTKPPQSHTTGTQSASQFTESKTTSLSTSTTLISTAMTSIKNEKNTSIWLHPVTGGDAATSPSSHKTTAVRHLIHTNKVKKKQGKATNHGKVVAGVIGAAIFLMMLGFLLIYIKKQRTQKQQTTTTDWAGPSPFLEGGTDNDKVILRSSNRISLSSFLPQRLSKRLSLLPETNEELQDMTPGTTFGGKHQGGTSGESMAEQKKNGVDGGVSVVDSKGEEAEATANSASAKDH